jgi:hypothetical protein
MLVQVSRIYLNEIILQLRARNAIQQAGAAILGNSVKATVSVAFTL